MGNQLHIIYQDLGMGCLTGPYSCKGQVSSTFGHKLFLHTHTLLITMLFPCRHPILVYPALSFQFVPWREKKSVLLSLYLYVVGLFMWPCTTSRLMINVDVCCAKLFWLITFHWFHGYICLIPHRPLTSHLILHLPSVKDYVDEERSVEDTDHTM